MKKVSNINIESEMPLPTPDEIRMELPVTAEIAENVWQFRQTIGNIISGRDPRILMICGPCSIDSIPAAMEYAMRLRALREKVEDRMFPVMRAYFEKPRTTIGWKGLVYDPDLDRSFHIEKGLRLSRKLLLSLAEMGIPAATEFLEPIIPQYTSDLISWASIGARTSESQTHRQMASGLSMPVGFKNSTDGSISVAVDAIRTASARHSFLGVINDGRTGVFFTRGNPFCHLVLRGGIHEPNYTSEYIAFSRELMVREKLFPSIVVDCSHANSQRNPLKQGPILLNVIEQILAGQNAIRGVMLESYMKTGRQDMDNKAAIIPGLSITDPCLGWPETEELILRTAEMLRTSSGKK